MAKKPKSDNTLVRNKKAFHDYEIMEKIEAGIELRGTEVKSCRKRDISLNDAYAKIENGEVFLINCHINPYEQGNRFNHDPLRKRKLLLHKQEIRRLKRYTEERGYTLVPLAFYLKRGLVKVALGLGRGRAMADKREQLKRKDAERSIQRAMKQYRG
ncbi:MAG: SsrA-binding protein SmpB [Lentisphaerae bacterium]|nr:MAG: SsrA-binding protein SmpB [Lentisphaerota bacterium]